MYFFLLPVKNDTVADIYIYMAQNMGYGIGFGNSSFLKGPKLEIFVAKFFTQSKPVWVDDLGTRK